ncbi:hypothetical protein [Streptomyces sp. NPDC048644]|uniref:hypothetical protein n=1 Tax=Streptomyces sp. NPDC048644 TaxID=3365582 RepID=UPI00371C24D6
MADPETGVGALAARSRALAVLRIRSVALGAAVLPAAAAVVLLVGGATGHLGGPDAAAGSGWGIARLAVSGVALLVLLLAALVGAVISGARPALSPSVPVSERAAPDLYRLVRDLADTLDVPAPSAIALTPDCDSWLEDRTHRAHGPPRRGPRRSPAAPVLVIGSPFLWWMRVGELRALLAPVVAGTSPSADPDIAAARRFIRGLDAAVAVSARAKGLRAPALRFVGRAARLMLRACREHATIMERGVAAAASERAQAIDHGLRTVAQEQVGLAYAGWDRLLTRVALPAWRLGRWPSCLDVGVVCALTELSRRDRLADGFTARLGERPACDLLEEPGAVDSAASLLAARLFHGGPTGAGPDWSPVDWSQYPAEVVDRTWRLEAARLHRVLDDLPATDEAQGERTRGAMAGAGRPLPGATARSVPGTLPGEAVRPAAAAQAAGSGSTAVGPAGRPGAVTAPARAGGTATARRPAGGPTLARVIDRLAHDDLAGDLVAARLGEELEREEHEEAARQAARGPAAQETPPDVSWGDGLADGGLPLFPLQPPRTDRELLAEHVTAMVCCAAVDTAGAAPGLDWLDGPALLVDGARRADFGSPVRSLVDEGDAEPLRDWLTAVGVRPEKPVRLV